MYVSSPRDESVPYLVHAPLPQSSIDDLAQPVHIPLAFDAQRGLNVYADSEFMVRTHAAATLHAHPRMHVVTRHFALETCTWIRHCTAMEMVGSPCSASLSNVHLSGFCFESAAGTLECGHSVGSSDFGLPLPLRCAPGSKSISLGSTTSPRLLSAGCMDPLDPSYSSLAEVHVPDYCSHGGDFIKGCMFHDALNFDPFAVQPGNCVYYTNGCTSSSALNYNADATDDDGSCIEPIVGCTLQQSALNYDSRANVLGGGCVLAIEGCMDSRALNYNANATFNQDTPCNLPVLGCMMPTLEGSASSCLANLSLAVDGLSVALDPLATVHRSSLCTRYRRGCIDSTALNYDSLATVSDSCYWRVFGCLNPHAANFKCRVNEYQTAPCHHLQPPHVVTQHDRSACHWMADAPAPPQPAPPPLAHGEQMSPSYIRIAFAVAGGNDAANDASCRDEILRRFMALLGVPRSDVSVDAVVQAGSVSYIVRILVTARTAATFEQAVRGALGNSTASAQIFLGCATLLSTPALAVVTSRIQAQESSESTSRILVSVAFAVSIAVIILLSILICARTYTDRRGRVEQEPPAKMQPDVASDVPSTSVSEQPDHYERQPAPRTYPAFDDYGGPWVSTPWAPGPWAPGHKAGSHVLYG